MHNSRKIWFCILSVICFLFIVSCSNSSKEPIEEDSFLYEGIRQLLEPMHQNNTFVIEGIPWLISKAEVIQQKQLIDIQIDEMDRIVVEGKLEPSMKQHVIYNFENDQLVSGEYWFSTIEIDRFDELGLTIKKILQESFPAPRTTNLDFLDAATASAGKKENIMWQGSDQSYMRVNVLTSDASEFMLQIHIASPIGEKNSLQKN